MSKRVLGLKEFEVIMGEGLSFGSKVLRVVGIVLLVLGLVLYFAVGKGASVITIVFGALFLFSGRSYSEFRNAIHTGDFVIRPRVVLEQCRVFDSDGDDRYVLVFEDGYEVTSGRSSLGLPPVGELCYLVFEKSSDTNMGYLRSSEYTLNSELDPYLD